MNGEKDAAVIYCDWAHLKRTGFSHCKNVSKSHCVISQEPFCKVRTHFCCDTSTNDRFCDRRVAEANFSRADPEAGRQRRMHMYRKIPRITPPFDAKKLTPKRGGGLIHEDLTFDIIDQ